MCPYHLISHLLQIILERSPKERNLEELKRKKFLVPEDMPLIHFQGIIRRRLNISPEKALFFLINADTLVSLTRQMDEIFRDYKAQDGCLHIFYASQDCFGWLAEVSAKGSMNLGLNKNFNIEFKHSVVIFFRLQIVFSIVNCLLPWCSNF